MVLKTRCECCQVRTDRRVFQTTGVRFYFHCACALFFIIVITPCVHYLRLWTSRLVMQIRNTSTEPWLSEYSVRNVNLVWTIPLNRPWQARSLDFCYGFAAHASYPQTLKWYLNIWYCQAKGRGRLCGPDHSTQICSHDQKNQTKTKTTETTAVVCSCFFPTTIAAVELRRRWIDHLQHLRVWFLASGAPRQTARWCLSPLAHGAERTARRLLSPADLEGNQRWRLEIKFLFHLPLYWSAEKGVLSGTDWTHLDLLLATVASLKADIFTAFYLFIYFESISWKCPPNSGGQKPPWSQELSDVINWQ